MKISTISSAIAVVSLTFGSLAGHAQTPPQPKACIAQATLNGSSVTVVPDLGRAKNLARWVAEQANGGLGQYRAEAAMHGPASEAPCVDNGDDTVTFTFKGGVPGAIDPSIESAVTVNRQTWQTTLDYNGPIRETTEASQPTAATTDELTLVRPNDPDLNRARNLARQAAVRENGGLDRYRTEAAMYGSTTTLPVVDNGDGTWTFTFKGGEPGFSEPTIETSVTVAKDGSQVTVDYNGPLRSQP